MTERQARDRSEIGPALDAYRTDVTLLGYRFLGSMADAEEATQETLLRAYAHLADFHGAHLSAWLYRIAANLCIDHARRRHLTTIPLGEDLVSDPELDPVAELERGEQRQAVRALVSELPECHQRILRLRYFEERSVAEIAGQVQCSPLAAKLRVFRAVERLEAVALPIDEDEA